MKYIFVLSLLLATSAMANIPHTFTDQSGRTVLAEIIQHDPSTGKVQLKRNKGKPIWISPSIFSSEDQLFIQNWIDESKFRESANFKISIEENKTSWASTGDTGGNRRKRSTTYKISLQNNNNEALEEIKVEYCIFRNRELNGDEFIESSITTNEIDSITAKSTEEIRTGGKLSFKKSNFLNEVAGLCVRVYAPTKNGSTLMQEVRYPDDLSDKIYIWGNTERE